jgi:hypothetical protein
VADRDNSDNGDNDEDVAWRDLVARFDAPLTAEEPVPWPEREGDAAAGVAGASGASGAFGFGVGRAPGALGGEADEVPGAYGPGADGSPGSREPHVMPVPRLVRGARGRGLPAAADDDDEHFVPPLPPPLPKLDPLAKGAWVALFGGPGYLVVATGAGWTVPGFAAFCAVAAFVAGFAILVLRMNEPGPGGPDDGDDGAVV